MLKQKKLYFILFVVLVVGYAIYDYKWEEAQVKEKDEKSVILSFKEDQVESFEIKTDKESISVQNKEGEWNLTQPLSDRADQDAVIQFIEGVVREKSKEIAVEGEKLDLAVFGLDQPKANFKFKLKTGQDHELILAGKKNFQGDSFLRRNQENKVLIASSTWFSRGEKTAHDFRDKRWIRIKSADIEKMTLIKGKDKLSLVKQNDKWVIQEKPDYILEQNKVRKLVNAFESNVIQKFDFSADSQPMMSIELGLKDNKKITSEFGINKDNKHFMKTFEPKQIVEVLSADTEAFYATTADSLRDRKIPFAIKVHEVKKIEVVADGKVTKIFKFKDEKWILEGNSAEINQEKFKNNLQAIESLEVKDFIEKQTHLKLGNNSSQLILKSAEDKILLQLDFAKIEKEKFLVRSSLFSSFFTMDADKITPLNFESIFVVNAKDEDNNKDNKENPDKGVGEDKIDKDKEL